MTELKLKRTIEAYAGALGAALAPSGRAEVREPTGLGVGGGWWRDGRLEPDRVTGVTLDEYAALESALRARIAAEYWGDDLPLTSAELERQIAAAKRQVEAADSEIHQAFALHDMAHGQTIDWATHDAAMRWLDDACELHQAAKVEYQRLRNQLDHYSAR